MIRKLKFLPILATLLLPQLALSGSASAFTFFNKDVCDRATDAAQHESPVCTTEKKKDTNNPVVRIIRDVANAVALLSGVLAVGMIIYSGFTMVVSAGNSEQINTARRRILAALGGLVVVFLAWNIVRIVTDRIL